MRSRALLHPPPTIATSPRLVREISGWLFFCTIMETWEAERANRGRIGTSRGCVFRFCKHFNMPNFNSSMFHLVSHRDLSYNERDTCSVQAFHIQLQVLDKALHGIMISHFFVDHRHLDQSIRYPKQCQLLSWTVTRSTSKREVLPRRLDALPSFWAKAFRVRRVELGAVKRIYVDADRITSAEMDRLRTFGSSSNW